MNNKRSTLDAARPMACIWLPVGDAEAPLACVWVEAEASRADSGASSNNEAGGMLLCA